MDAREYDIWLHDLAFSSVSPSYALQIQTIPPGFKFTSWAVATAINHKWISRKGVKLECSFLCYFRKVRGHGVHALFIWSVSKPLHIPSLKRTWNSVMEPKFTPSIRPCCHDYHHLLLYRLQRNTSCCDSSSCFWFGQTWGCRLKTDS